MGASKPHTPLFLGLFALVFFVTGERPSVDPRFFSPASAVRSFWHALGSDSPGQALECFVGVGHQTSNGRLLRLPPMDFLEIRNVIVDPRGTGVALVRYEVHYRVKGGIEGTFESADEVARVRGEWRILRPVSAHPRILRLPSPPRPRVHVTPGPEYARDLLASHGGDLLAACAVVDRPGGAC
jgi:hypothetical protein